jgi:opacity protein-like surface antigen
MLWSRRAVYLSFIVFLLTPVVPVVFAPLAFAQEADSTAGIEHADIETLPFAVNAGNYRLKVYPELSIGLGLNVANPDLSNFDNRYRPEDKPSSHSPFAGMALIVRLQPLSWLAVSASMEGKADFELTFDSDNDYNRYSRYALSVTAHHALQPGSAFSVFGGAGITRINYEHAGSYATYDVLRITSRTTGAHLTGGVEGDIVGGPILSLHASYDFMPDREDMDLSSFRAGFMVLFQF